MSRLAGRRNERRRPRPEGPREKGREELHGKPRNVRGEDDDGLLGAPLERGEETVKRRPLVDAVSHERVPAPVEGALLLADEGGEAAEDVQLARLQERHRDPFDRQEGLVTPHAAREAPDEDGSAGHRGGPR